MSDLNKLKELAEAIVDNLVDCGGADPEAVERYIAWTQKKLSVAFSNYEKRVAELDAVIAQRNAECDRLIIEKGLARINAAPGKPVAYADPMAFKNFASGAASKEWMWAKKDAGLFPLYATPAAPSAPDGWTTLPAKLSAENGAKAALSGEFLEVKFISCPECFGDDDCDSCDGSGRIKVEIPVSWTTIKAIWEKGVQHFSAAPAPGGGDA